MQTCIEGSRMNPTDKPPLKNVGIIPRLLCQMRFLQINLEVTQQQLIKSHLEFSNVMVALIEVQEELRVLKEERDKVSNEKTTCADCNALLAKW